MPFLYRSSLYLPLCLLLLLGCLSPALGWEAVPPPAKKAKVKQIKKKHRRKASLHRSAPRQHTVSTKLGTFWEWLLLYTMLVLSILLLLVCLVSIVYCVLGMIWFVGFGWDILFPIIIALFIYLGLAAIIIMDTTFYTPSYADRLSIDYGPLLAILGGIVALNLFILGLMLGLTWLWLAMVIAAVGTGLGIGIYAILVVISMG